MKTNLFKSIFISLILLVVGATNAWAYDVKSPHVYFNATNVSSWPGVNIVVGHDSYSFGDLMSKVSNTNLYYAKVTFNGSDANGFVFIGANSKWGAWNNQSLYDRTQGQSNRTDYLWFYNTITGGLPSGTYYFSTSGNKKAIDYSQYTTIPTFNTTSAVRVRTGTSGTYSNASGTYPANISIQGTYISDNGKTNRTSITSTTSSDGDDKKVYGSVITGLVTLSYSNLNEAYTFDGWGTSDSKVSSTSTNYEFNQSAPTTVYAFFTKKTYTITYKQGANGSGSIDAGTKEHGVNYTLSSNKFTRTGYTQTGWSTSDGGAKVYDLGGTYTANTDVTLYPFWTPNTYTITYKDQGNVDFSGTNEANLPAQHTYGTATTLVNGVKTGFNFDGWFTTQDCTGSAVTSLGATAYTANITLYAKWTIIEETKYDVTISSAGNGTVEPSGTQKVGASGIDIAATANTGYQFTNWETTGGASIADANSASTTVTATAAGTATANFTEILYAITVKSANNNHGTVTQSTDKAGIATTMVITASPKAGYEFVNWTADNGITLDNANSATTTITKATATGTVTANFQEKKHNVTVSYKYGDITIKDNTTTSDVGEVTSTNITAPTIAGYTFSSWTLETGITNKSANTTTNPISITTNSSGTYTLTANYEEDLSTGWYLAGEFSNNGDPDTGWNANKIEFTKLSGQSTGSVSYITMELLPTTFTDDYLMSFKIVNGSNWYGNNGTYKKASNNQQQWQFEKNKNNCQLEVSLPGTYTFRLQSDSTNSTKYISITYPVVNQLQVYSATPSHNEATKNWNWDTHNGDVYSKTLSLNANTKYEFKAVLNSDFYGKTTTLTRETPSVTLNTSGGDVTLQTDIAGDYTFTFNSSDKKLDITYPTAYKVIYTSTYTGGTVSATAESNTLHLPNTEITFTATPKTGYTFQGWQDGHGTQLSIANPYTHKMTKDITINAVFEENTYNIAIVADPAEAAETLTSSPQTVGVEPVAISTTAKFTYRFDNWEATDGITITDATNPSTSITATKAGTVTAHFTQLQPTTVYLKPNEDWKKDNARFAIHYWHDGQPAGWVDMTDAGCNRDYFVGVIPAGYTDFLFARMNPNNLENKWDAGIDWNKTADLVIPTNNNNCYTITSTGSKDPFTAAAGNWGTYTEPTYDVTINITGKGSIVIDGQTYTSNSTGTVTQTIKNIEVNTNINVTAITPADRWANKTATIKIGNNTQETLTAPTSHSICGPTTINVTFEQTKFVVHFELQLPENTEHPEIDDQIVDKNTTAAKPQVNNIEGHIFGGWYTDAACSIDKEYDFNTPVTKDITLYAKWIPYGDCIFYKNNLNWDEIYVYFYSSNKYWDDSKGTGSEKEKEIDGSKAHYREFRGEMTQLGKTDIWYFDYISAAKRIDSGYWEEIKASTNIAFTAHEQYNYEFFDNTKVIRRGDFNRDMQLFIPQTDQTPTYLNKHDGISTRYYNKGLWMKYNDTYSGYDWRGATSEDPNNGQWNTGYNFTADKAGGYSFTTTVSINSTNRHFFKVNNLNNTWYGHTETMSQDNCTDWWFKEDVNDNAKIEPTITGEYVFTVFLGEGKVEISLDYPLSVGDYRLAYKDNQAGSFHPGHYIKKRNTSKNDTVSFFIHHHDNEPQVIAQRCTAIDNNGNATWETITPQVNPAASITEKGVYNFTLQQIEGQNDPQLLNQARPYTGNYYIRTDAAPGGWKSFRQEGNMMTYNSYADNNEDFDHYFCEWVSQEKGLKNVKYTVANDYSYCISDTLSEDIDSNHPKIVTNTEGDLPKDNKGNLMNANVRWGWDSKTNKIRRAYIAGSGHKKDRFLVLEGNASLLDVNGKRFTGNTAEGQDRYNLKDDEVVFDDMGNWIYQIDVKANKDTEIDLTALYNGKTQYFKGGDQKGEQLIVTTAGNTNYYKMRLIYDFKINKLIIAWLPEDEVDNQELEVNMMIIRHNQEKAQQLNFKQSAKLSGIETAYAVMTFDKYFLNNKDSKTGAALPQANEKSENERKFYWVSFPFDVKLSDVFGFGEYGDYWIMEYYDGAGRAEQGYWAETETFWKYITNKNYILKAGQGYVLYLNLNKMKFESNVFAHTSEVSLYFPSLSLPNVISGDLPTAVDVPEHTCTIERDNRNIYDSNWNLIGVPGFADISDVTIGDTHHKELNNELNANCVSFYYKYLPGTNTYSATTQTEIFQTMCAYMVQFAGTINWQAKTMPAQLAARRTGSTPSQYDLRLELAQGEKIDQTFVQLKEADATAEFDMNVDMTKIFNNGMNIYTLTGSNAIQVAGNALPMEKATVPVGVRIATAGEYTFRMPNGTEGISVILLDKQTGAQTNMLMEEYTVTLDAGTIENRFYLVVDPDRAATSVENVGEEAKGDKAKGVEKFLIDGKLFIRTADGIFDAQGHKL